MDGEDIHFDEWNSQAKCKNIVNVFNNPELLGQDRIKEKALKEERMKEEKPE